MATPIKPIAPIGGATGSATSGSSIFNFSFLSSTTFWIVAFVGLIFGVIIYFWITQRDKKEDPFLKDFKIKKAQCKIFKESDIDNVYVENQRDGLIKIGKYEGECIDKEGYRDIMFSKLRLGKIGGFLRKILFFTIPILDLVLKKYWIVRCNVEKAIYIPKEIIGKDNKPRKSTKKYVIPVPVITRGRGALIVHAEGLQLKKYYTYPILQNIDGNIIKDEEKNFMRERDTVLMDTLYQQTMDFVNVQREAINLNPNVRYTVKTEGRAMPTPEGGQ